ncbi:hypothetical protein TRAPUB_7086 [Trametes pubescens]|uniref:F-box domain-containing protein n=1 Tax=Trametes pubescens TaxID=154538 RepID=A0A1M2V475_TRAPU|nr:hypothetical protein TRAPUB_7086 [Trametes pubescens]
MSLSLAFHPDTDHLRHIVKSLSLLSPRLEDLSLRRGGPPSGGFANIASPGYRPTLRGTETCELLGLTSFTTRRMFVAYDALLGLGGLPHLRKLHINPPFEASDWAPPGQERRDAFFVALEELVLTGKKGNHQGCIDFVGIITPTSLRTVTLDLRWPKDGTAEALFAALCAALGGLPCHGTIKDIKITLGFRDDRDENIYRSPCFAPLLELHALQSLSIEGGPKVVVDDATLDAMSRAWPSIRTLRFAWPTSPRLNWWEQSLYDRAYTPPGADAPDRPGATLAGLVPLALRCAHLEELEVAIDMRAVPTFDGHRRPPVFVKDARLACKVKALCTEGCVPGDPWAVASFLSLVLPRLGSIGGSTPRATWERTFYFYRVLQAVRFQERDWAIGHRKNFKDPAGL